MARFCGQECDPSTSTFCSYVFVVIHTVVSEPPSRSARVFHGNGFVVHTPLSGLPWRAGQFTQDTSHWFARVRVDEDRFIVGRARVGLTDALMQHNRQPTGQEAHKGRSFLSSLSSVRPQMRHRQIFSKHAKHQDGAPLPVLVRRVAERRSSYE